VGAYLSGGLDSSTVAALAKDVSGVAPRTFSITFEDAAFDESGYQSTMVEHLGSNHSTVALSRPDIADHFAQTIRHTETPVLRTAPVPMNILSRLVRDEGFKVVLTGEGADEVLGGYDLFKEAKVRQFWARYPDSELRASLLKRLYPYLDLGQSRASAYSRQFFGQALDQPDLPFFSHLPRWTTTARTKQFLSEDLTAELAASAEEALMVQMPVALGSWHPFHRAQYLEAKTLMAGYLLCSQGDRMLMANSVEGRFPFLDHRLIEFANALDPKHKMRGLNEKSLLKRAVAAHVPPAVVSRHKQPYRAPDIGSFFSEAEPPDYVRVLLSGDALREAGYFDVRRVERLLKKIGEGRAVGANDNMALVGILSTQIWHATFVRGFDDFR
jgi:asparagine synthase (glutamine-hydrolysing)